MSDILKFIDLNAAWEQFGGYFSDFVCGSGHVIPKHVLVNTLPLHSPFLSTSPGLMAAVKDRSVTIVVGYINIVKFNDNM